MKLVIAAVNRLYVLDLNILTLAHEAVTGPALDSPFCNSELTSCIGSRDTIVDTDNWNKLLLPLIDKNINSTKLDINALLVCGSVRQGECQLRNFPTLEKLREHRSLSGNWQHVPVVANSPLASTAAILVGDRLFVATGTSSEIPTGNPYREAFPAVTTRLLSDGLQTVNAGSLDGEAAVHIRVEYRRHMQLNYLYAFRDQHFIYWLAVQPRSPNTGAALITRLIRVCLEDDRYTSYSELELQCRSAEDNTLFAVARAGTFYSNKRELWAIFTDYEGQRSAICAFSLNKIRMTFWYNIDRCRGGTDNIGLAYIGRDAKCTNRSHLPLSEDTCLIGVGGAIEASAPALAHFPGRILNALDVAEVDNHLLVVVGTKAGEVIQMKVIGERATRRLQTYADYRVVADPIERITIISEKQRFLLSAGKEVLLLRLSSCDDNFELSSNVHSCSDCINSGDPLCAWCLSLGRCTHSSSCPSPSSLSSSIYLKNCPNIRGHIRPENISLSSQKQEQIFVPLSGLPTNSIQTGKIKLEYSIPSSSLIPFRSSVRLLNDGIECETPTLENFSSLSANDFQRVNVQIRTILTLFSCSFHQLCSSCASSKWPCRWCATEKRCLDVSDWNNKCPREHALNQNNGCARILEANGLQLVAPDSSNVSLEFSVENLPSTSIRLNCRMDGGSLVKALILSNGKNVRCPIGLFGYKEHLPLKNFTLELLAGLEPFDATKVSIYKCEYMATDCSRCMALDPVYSCSWCGGICRHIGKCPSSLKDSRTAAADELCTSPTIYSFSPNSGPLEGGTLVEIIGRDLGSSLQDVKDRVLIAGIPCQIKHYEASEKILCETGPSLSPISGPIKITIGRSGRRSVDSIKGKNEENKQQNNDGIFNYLSPEPNSVQPNFGPQSGGTRFEIFGKNLNVGRNVSVHFDNLECQIVGEERLFYSDQLSCLTGSSTRRAYTVTAIRLQIDKAVRLIPDARFEYRADPIIIDIQPRTAPEGGGRNLTIFGNNFDSIISPKIFLLSPPIVSNASPDEWELVSELGTCILINKTQMICSSPRLALPTALLRHSQMARWNIGFAMDGVQNVRNLGDKIQLTTVPDPQFSPFIGVQQLQYDQPLQLSGQWLSQAADPDEYYVSIGMELCPVFLLEPDHLLCRPPSHRPLPTDDSGAEMADGRPLVVVRVGRVRVEIGPLDYLGGDSTENLLDSGEGIAARLLPRQKAAAAAILAAIACALLALGTVTAALLGWRRRRCQGVEHERSYKRIQLQMEQMESQVRQECKQAFAELQTDVLSELDTVIENGKLPTLLNFDDTNPSNYDNNGTLNKKTMQTPTSNNLIIQPPILSRSEFISRLLFKGETFPTFLGVQTLQQPSPVAFAQFESLLQNRSFLYVLVQMAEEDNNMGASERSMLASLLLVTLGRDWAFLSDVVLSLLSAHIQRCCLLQNQNNQPPLLFRHSESLGPVDAITGQSRYSIAEQSLLREPLEAKTLNLFVIPLDETESSQELLIPSSPVQFRVLDCDTIGQTKAKLLDALYSKNVALPFSQRRLFVEHFDLEWRCPRRGPIILLDDEETKTSVRGREPKRLNTLAYYGVPDRSLLYMQWKIVPPSIVHSQQQHTFRSGNPKKSRKRHKLSNNKNNISTKNIEKSPPPPEVLLTRLLMCKGALQRFFETFFEQAILLSSSNIEQQQIPVVLKYVFDFLDIQATQSQVPISEETLHAWKSNCWVLRFWQQLIQSPSLLFDVPERQQTLAGSLAVLGQTIVDIFSLSELKLGKESPSCKLLFAPEIARYRPLSIQLIKRIQEQPPISPQYFYEYLSTLNEDNKSIGLSPSIALKELFGWAKANGIKLIECLENNLEAKQQRLGERLKQCVAASLGRNKKENGNINRTITISPTYYEENVYATLN
uniref:Sema domain-containing protein n=1 Tax=Meloidogyne javanica TaxID=6303 RepID=A0A915MX25_MELJA